jgi:thiamine-phosphate pyrophosphorylase
MKPLSECHLYTFVDTAYLHGRRPEAVTEQLCAGGADLIQLRAKEASPDEVRELASALLPITRKADVGLVINDHPAIARQIGAELCHLGQEDFFGAGFTHVEQLTPASGIRIGLSTHRPEQARSAVQAGAAYVAIGPVYATPTKPTAKPVTLDYVRWAAANLIVPWFAIGGITLENLEAVLGAGAQRVCVVSTILNATDVAAQCKLFKAKLQPPAQSISKNAAQGNS